VSKWRKAIYASLGAEVGFSPNHPESGHAASDAVDGSPPPCGYSRGPELEES